MALVPGPAVHINAFFAHYPTFQYNTTTPVTREFRRMCTFFHWGGNSTQRKDARESLGTAMVLQFNAFYGTDIHDINSWQNLCQVLEIDPIPDSITACRKVRYYKSILNVKLMSTQGCERNLRESSRPGRNPDNWTACQVVQNRARVEPVHQEAGEVLPERAGEVSRWRVAPVFATQHHISARR